VRRSAELVHQPHHFQGCLGTFLTFVSGVSSSAVNGLLQRVAREHTEQHWHAGLQCNLAKAQADLPVDVLVVRRFAANYRSKNKRERTQ
jgi:hypothetical protein